MERQYEVNNCRRAELVFVEDIFKNREYQTIAVRERSLIEVFLRIPFSLLSPKEFPC